MKKEYISCLKLLEEYHGRLYVAGGPVRDLLLDRETPDIDIVVPHNLGGLPADFARGVKGRYVLLHDKQDQVTERVIIQGQAPLVFDFTRMQGASIEEDLSNRDFTFNAMALPLGDFIGGRRDRIMDPRGGRKALREQRISAVSERSFLEDPLRLLRAFRFAAELHFRIDPETLRWIRTHRRLLEGVSSERIRDELCRILSCLPSRPIVVEMDRVGILEVLFPEISAMKEEGRTKICGVDPWKHALAALHALETVMEKPGDYFKGHASEFRAYIVNEIAPGRGKAALIKLVALLGVEDSPGESGAEAWDNLILRLRLSRKEGVFLRRISRRARELSVLMSSDEISRKGAALFFSRNKDDYFGLFLVYLGSFVASKKSGLQDAKKKTLDLLFRYEKEIKPILQSPPLIDGADLMDSFYLKPGPVIGKILTSVRTAQLEGVIGNRSQALALVGKVLKK